VDAGKRGGPPGPSPGVFFFPPQEDGLVNKAARAVISVKVSTRITFYTFSCVLGEGFDAPNRLFQHWPTQREVEGGQLSSLVAPGY